MGALYGVGNTFADHTPMLKCLPFNYMQVYQYHLHIYIHRGTLTVMSFIFTCQLNEAEINNFHNKLARRTHLINFCHVWYGQLDRDGYGILRIKFRGRMCKVRVHRLQYFLKNNCPQMFTAVHVSHLCHVKGCINIEHLSYETAAVNRCRNECFKNGECQGHRGYAKCIL